MAITNFTPKVFTNDSGEPINAANLNEMQRVLDALNKECYTREEVGYIAQQYANVAVQNANKYTESYKQPWDLNQSIRWLYPDSQKVGNSYTSHHDFTTPVTATQYVYNRGEYVGYPKTISRSIEIPMINSGKIQVKMWYSMSVNKNAVDLALDKNGTKILVCLNDNVIKTFKYGNEGFIYYDDGSGQYYGSDSWGDGGVLSSQIDVKDGDTLKVEAIIQLVEVLPENTYASSVGADIGFARVGIFANVNTPYKYLSLPFVEKVNGQLVRSV